MARVFGVNGADFTYLTAPNWVDELNGAGLDGNSPLNRWRRLTVRGSIMPMDEWNALRALEGQRVSVTCPPYGDRNADYVTYYGANFLSLSGKHESINMGDVTLDFVVLI